MAALPLLGLRRLLALDATCLVIGSMAPDFEYFVRGEEVSQISHTLRGIALFDVPMTLVLALLWHRLVKWPVLLVAPVSLARRLAPLLGDPWPARIGIGPALGWVVSAAIGAATHLVWDGMTHAQGYGPQHIPALREPVDVPLRGPMILHRLLQHTSTVIGLAVIAFVVVRAVRRQSPVALPPVERAGPRAIFALAVGIGVTLVTGRLVVLLNATDIGDMIVGPIAGALAGTIVASLLVRRRAAALRA